jgi:hypothetical protein
MKPRRLAVVVLLLTAGCAAKIPPETSFSRTEWAAVETVAPGARVEVHYVTGNPPLRHYFAGRLRVATSNLLEIETADGIQRLDPNRVRSVAVGGRGSRMAVFVPVLALAGALVTAAFVAIQDDTDEPSARKQLIGAAVGGGVGALAGIRRGDARPRVVYQRDR